MNDDKLNLLKKALSSDSDGISLGRPSLEHTSPGTGESKISLQNQDKFSGPANPTGLKGLKDPKGKNKQVLKGNAKSKHKR